MKFFHGRNGQTIIEALVALSILTVGFLGILSLLTQSFALSRVTAGQTTATYLAAEGIEVTKNILDHDVYQPGNIWGTCGLACTSDGAYTVSYGSLTPTLLALNGKCLSSSLSVPALLFASSTGLYSYGVGGQPTVYHRCVEIDHVLNAGKTTSVTVISYVTWSSGMFSSSVDLEDHFYNWHP